MSPLRLIRLLTGRFEARRMRLNKVGETNRDQLRFPRNPLASDFERA